MSRNSPELVVHALAWLLLLAPSGAAGGVLRSPQVPVLTGRLQSYLDGLGESIQVNTDQLAAQTGPLRTALSVNNFTLNLTLGGNYAGGDSIGVYNAGDASPTLMRVFPAQATIGWFAVLAFEPSPQRLLVALFDANVSFVSATTYLGVDPTDFGFYLQGPNGTFFMQDARNPNDAPQMLAFTGTGIDANMDLLCWEDAQVGAGSDQDFDDVVLVEECTNCMPDPVMKSTWGALKQRFR